MIKLLFIPLFYLSFNLSATVTLEKKVKWLYETNQSKDASYAINEIKSYCKYLEKYNELNPKKRIKKIFDDTKEKYLRYYKLESSFSRIFSTQTYNCVTGSALFALIFDELKIPYKVIEVPNHIYLLTHPNSLKIAVESTDANKGIYPWSDYTKTSAINYLISIGKITEREVYVKGMDAVIVKYFYTNQTLSFSDLVGIHFYNDALFKLENDKYKQAYKSIIRSSEFYENERTKIITGTILAHLIIEEDDKNIDVIEYVLQYCEIAQKQKQKNLALDQFKFSGHLAYERKDIAYLDSAEVLIFTILTDTQDVNLFLGNLKLFKSGYYALKGEKNKALQLAIHGYNLSPETKFFEDLIAQILVTQYENNYDVDANEIIDSMTVQMEKYPFLIDVPIFYSYYVFNNIEIIGDYFFFENEAEIGFQKLDTLDALIATKDIELESWYEESRALLYASISTYYYREKQYNIALDWIDKAQILDDKNESFERKKKLILENISN